MISTEPVPDMPVCGSVEDLRSRSGSREKIGTTSMMTSLSPSRRVAPTTSSPQSEGTSRASLVDAHRRPPLRARSSDATYGSANRNSKMTTSDADAVKTSDREFLQNRDATPNASTATTDSFTATGSTVISPSMSASQTGSVAPTNAFEEVEEEIVDTG